MPDGFRPARTRRIGECAHHVAFGHGTGKGEGDALVLLCGDSQPRDLDTLDMETLLVFQLVTPERLSPGASAPRVTLQEYALLKSVGVLRACKGVLVAVA